ncbi:MAG TPA: prephenate dehydrogenase/arogenate dehydrogenase family protein [Dehalococcoidia bacterium]|nr:prephenate dehydrogenase/arogenate dehydrogenase family protein [Dehalococcoidia bacterium]
MRVAIIGLGLIGGSIGLALKQANESGWEIVGYARRPEAASTALNSGVVDRIETSLAETVKEADLIILATPVLTIKKILSQIAGNLRPNCVVTDTASTKVQVMKWAEEILPPKVSFIGGHPMAGRETYGIKAAKADLFRGCIYCLIPSEKASPQAIDKVTSMVKRLGARPVLIDAQEHDELVAGISHLPMLLSAALVSATAQDDSWHKMSELAASGYRDLTRLASGNPEVNAHICLSNQKAILRWIDKFSRELERYRQLVAKGDKRLEQALIEANQARQAWLNKIAASS